MTKRFAVAVLVVLFAALPCWSQTVQQKKATVEYLKKLQNKDGGFSPAEGQTKSALGATSSALRAIKYSGGDLDDKAACVDFVKSCFDKASGGFAEQAGGKPAVNLTAIGLMALVELKVDLEPYVGPAVKYLDDNAKGFDDIRIAVAGLEAVGKKSTRAAEWTEQIKKMANDDGTFGKGEGKARETGGATVAVLRLGGKVEHPDVVLKALNAGQRPDGGFGKADAKESDLESTYRVLRAYHMMKAKPDVAQLRGFLDSCRNRDGGYGVTPGKPSTVSATYYAAIVQHWLEEK
jgi:prenyltransferase beta subunit